MPVTRTVDGVVRHPETTNSIGGAPAAAVPIQRRTFTAPTSLQPKKRWWRKILFPLFVVICMCASFLLTSMIFGVIVVGIYALVAWIRHIPSKASFLVAFLSLITVIALLVIRQNVTLANNFATYTFLLFIVGVVSLTLESRANPRHKRSKMHR